MSNRWLLPALLVLGVVALATLVVVGSGDNARVNTPADDATPSLRWSAGTIQRYKVASDSSMRMTAAGSLQSSFDADLGCVLDMQTLSVGNDKVTVGMKLSAVELQINNTVDAETNRALSVPFRVRYATNGLPVAFEFPADVSAQNRFMLEALVRLFQLSIAPSPTWIAQESNGNGTYEAVYTRSGPMAIDKSKRNFSAPDASILAGARISSTETLRIEPAFDWIKSMRVDESLTTTSSNGLTVVVKNQATLRLWPGAQVAVGPETWDFEATPATARTSAGDLLHPVPDLSPEEARRQIESTVPKLDEATQGRLMLVHRLRDLLRVDEALPAVLLDMLRTQQLNDRTRADIYLAFEGAGTESAQSALTSVIDDNIQWSLRDRMRAIVALGGVDEPSSDSIAALWNTVNSGVYDSDSQRVVSAASYALGSLGNRMMTADDPGYDALRSELLSNAIGGVSDKQRGDFLIAVGNTKDSTMAPQIVGLLDDDSAAIRRATALSLGMLAVDEVADSLVSSYRQEDDSRVRSAIIESLASWSQPTESAMATFQVAIETERDESVRYNLAVLIGNNIAEFPENEDLLRKLMRYESSNRIRQKIAAMLSGS